MYKLDYAGYEPTNKPEYNGNKIICWIEVEGRVVPHDKYPTYMLSLHKIEAELERFRVTGLPAYLVVRFTDVATAERCVRASSRRPSVDAGFPESSTIVRKRSIVNYRSRDAG